LSLYLCSISVDVPDFLKVFQVVSLAFIFPSLSIDFFLLRNQLLDKLAELQAALAAVTKDM
jgi:hypothetical protein